MKVTCEYCGDDAQIGDSAPEGWERRTSTDVDPETGSVTSTPYWVVIWKCPNPAHIADDHGGLNTLERDDDPTSGPISEGDE